MGILQWIRTNLTDPAYYATSINALRTSFYLELLREIGYRHPFQRPAVFQLLRDCFEIDYDLDALAAVELKKELLENMLYLMRCGYIMPILEYVQNWATTIDQALMRHFVTKLLEMIEGPYSEQFLHKMLEILDANIDAFHNPSADISPLQDTLGSFIGECNILTSDRDRLSKLQAVFPPPRQKFKIKITTAEQHHQKANEK